VHTTCEGKRNDVKDSFYKKLGCIFDRYPRYNMKNLLADFNAKVDRENISKRTIGKRVYMKLVVIMELE
jgi:hypothetical protein